VDLVRREATLVIGFGRGQVSVLVMGPLLTSFRSIASPARKLLPLMASVWPASTVVGLITTVAVALLAAILFVVLVPRPGNHVCALR